MFAHLADRWLTAHAIRDAIFLALILLIAGPIWRSDRKFTPLRWFALCVVALAFIASFTDGY